jgi:ribosomal protein S18 acetylase RimI-like enzyme
VELIFRKPTIQDKDKIDEFLILVKNDYIPPFTKEEREAEISSIYAGKEKAILSLTQRRQLVGYIVWKQYPKNKNYGYIANLAVHPTFRRKGISTKLRRMAFAEIKRAGYIGVYTMTWHKNTSIIESNKKLGMKVVKIYLDEKFRGPGGRTYIFRKDF